MVVIEAKTGAPLAPLPAGVSPGLAATTDRSAVTAWARFREFRSSLAPLDVLCLAGLALWGVASIIFTLLTAALLTHPLLHLALGGSTSALLTAGAYASQGTVSLWAIIPLSVVGTALFDPLFWWAGRRYSDRFGKALVRHKVLAPSSVERAESWASRFGGWAVVVSYFLPLPNLVVDAAVGAGGMPLWQFALLDVCAALLWTGVLVGLGYGVGQPALDLVKDASSYALWITVAIAVVLVLVLVWRHRPSARAAR